METMILAFNAVFPLLAFMMVGYFLGRIKLLNDKTAAGLNKLVFNVLLPLSIFYAIYKADIKGGFDVKLSLYVAITCAITYIIISFIVNSREKDKTIAPVMTQAIHKANYNLLAIPIAESFFGSSIGMTAVLAVIITPIVNICSTVEFERAKGGRVSILKMLKKIILNPLVLSSLLGLLANLSGIKLPDVIAKDVISKLAAMATPAAMLALGAGFDFSKMKKWAKRLTVICVGKLIILPLILVPGAILLGIRGVDLIAVLVYSGSHSAVNSYSTAVSMGGNEELAGEAVAVTSLLCVFTLFVFLTVLGTLGFI